MGIFIAIEGVDGAGKQTQAQLLTKALEAQGYRVRKLSFPCYESQSSALVKMYLSGEFGKSAEDVNCYAASAFYAADRFASFASDWKTDFLDPNCIIVSDRYVGSNAVHQGSKCKPEELDDYLDWLSDFEFNKMGIPVPTVTLWLNTDEKVSAELTATRKNKFTANEEKDIHEADIDYMGRCFIAGTIIAEKWGWKNISCATEGEMKRAEDISAEILKTVQPCLP